MLTICSNSDGGVTGQKRPSDNAANGPTAKKANTAKLEPCSDEGEKLVEEYPIPDQLVGLVIGRGGENIQRIQAETNVTEIQNKPTPYVFSAAYKSRPSRQEPRTVPVL